jgi:hypothetical protein
VELHPGEEEAFPWSVTVALTVRGVRSEAPVRARMDVEGDQVRVEAYGAFRFTDFGIEPYRAFLGAVRNRDTFHLYLRLVAERRSALCFWGSDGRRCPGQRLGHPERHQHTGDDGEPGPCEDRRDHPEEIRQQAG